MMIRACCALLLLLTGICGLAEDSNVTRRGNLDNARIRFTTIKRGHVAFIGGSITEMDGYRPMVSEALKKRFPETEFVFTNAGIASTCSTTGAFRLKQDVLSKGPVDLLFLEFAVNDDQDAHHTREECIRGIEGIILNLRRYNPKAEIVITYFVNENFMKQYRAGEIPLPIKAHEEVAAHYGISTIGLAKEVTTRIDKGEFDWKKFGGVHPAPFGNAIAADMIGKLLDECWKTPLPEKPETKDLAMPAKPLDDKNYEGGRFLELGEVPYQNPWKMYVPDWSKVPGSKRGRFNSIPLVEGSTPGATLTLKFKGTAIGAFILAGPDAGMVEASVDGGAPVKINLFHGYSKDLNYPRTVMFADTLEPKDHTLTLKILDEKDAKSQGNVMRALYFVANDELLRKP
jgi:lysophospholipase L1-like esterase